MSKSNYTVITFGTYDLFHLGHLQIIERARAIADMEGAKRGVPGVLVVGVSSDKLTQYKKKRTPIVPETERLRIVAALKAVDCFFLEESLELKCAYVEQFCADCLVMGDDHIGRFEEVEILGCSRVFLPRTSNISTTERLELIQENSNT
jgi:cytidyltransferase-like protein